jgi:hypothetical protein
MLPQPTSRFLHTIVALALIALATMGLWGCRHAAANSEESPAGATAVTRPARPAGETLRDGQALSEIDRFFGAPLGVPQRTN